MTLIMSTQSSTFAQDLQKMLEKSYEDLLYNESQKLNITVKAYKVGQEDQPIDRGTIEYIKIPDAYYMKAFDLESYHYKQQLTRIDHKAEVVDVIKKPDLKLDEEILGLPLWLAYFDDQTNEKIRIENSSHDGEQVYQIFREDYLEMEMVFQDDKLTKLTSYPKQAIVFRGRTLLTIVVMEYAYEKLNKTEKNKILSRFEASKNPSLLKKQYAAYDVKDHRTN